MLFHGFASSPVRKVLYLTLFFLGILLAVCLAEYIGRREFLIFFAVASMICLFADAISIIIIDIVRRSSPQRFANVWFGTIPRLMIPLMAAVLFAVFLPPDESPKYLSALVLVYLASLPFAVWLTLPKS